MTNLEKLAELGGRALTAEQVIEVADREQLTVPMLLLDDDLAEMWPSIRDWVDTHHPNAAYTPRLSGDQLWQFLSAEYQTMPDILMRNVVIEPSVAQALLVVVSAMTQALVDYAGGIARLADALRGAAAPEGTADEAPGLGEEGSVDA